MRLFAATLLLFISIQAFSQTAGFVGDRYRIQTSSGYMDIGSLNSGFGHFYTDRAEFYFNKRLTLQDGLDTYNSNYLHIQTPSGYVAIGPGNPGFSHFLTDRSRFYFSKKVLVNGEIGSYNQDLVLETSETPRITVRNDNGYVGIGNATPEYGLDVSANAAFRSTTYFYNSIAYAFEPSSGQYLHFKTNGGKGYVGMNSGNDMILQVNQGNVGIGTNEPSHTLDVAGTIRSQEVIVEVANGPDYVFEPDYELLSLRDIKNYISANKHLPEVPSAKEMESEGVEVGKFNMLLLKKVEELTLHQIDLLEQLEKQNKLLIEQQKRIDQLENANKNH